MGCNVSFFLNIDEFAFNGFRDCTDFVSRDVDILLDTALVFDGL